MMDVDVVLPCLNEAQALPQVLRALPPGYRAIVVDNGSTDGSQLIARAHGAVVVEETRRGFGAAVNAGVVAATAPVIAIMDADGSFDPQELPRLVARLSGADLVLGNRVPTHRAAWPLHARLANLALTVLIRQGTGLRLHDLGPMRVMRREALQGLALQDRRSGYPLEMLLRAQTAGLRVAELPVSYHPRLGKSKVTGTLRGTLVAVRDMRRQLRLARIGRAA
jgi:glycosyltransferase involved in cell wall biosynthesis